jgi:pimeloyl-ACP methyl ester carboxylesterase
MMLAHEWITCHSSEGWNPSIEPMDPSLRWDDNIDCTTVLLIHGILGNRRNMIGFAKRLVADFSDWRVCVVDLRHHGDSRDFPPPNDLASCAQDLLNLDISPSIVIGHSFGGKVALALSELIPVRQVWALDSPPGVVQIDPNDSSSVLNVIAILKEIPLPITSRQDLIRQLEVRLSRPIAMWMTTNVRETPEGLRWAFNLPAVEEMLASYREASFKAMLRAPHPQTDYHFVRAVSGRGFAVPDAQNVYAHDLANSGHWVHIDNPSGILDLMRLSLPIARIGS